MNDHPTVVRLRARIREEVERDIRRETAMQILVICDYNALPRIQDIADVCDLAAPGVRAAWDRWRDDEVAIIG